MANGLQDSRQGGQENACYTLNSYCSLAHDITDYFLKIDVLTRMSRFLRRETLGLFAPHSFIATRNDVASQGTLGSHQSFAVESSRDHGLQRT